MFGPPESPGTTLSGHDLRFPPALWVKDLKYLGPLFDEVTARSRIASLVRVEGEILTGNPKQDKLRCEHYAVSARKALVDVQREAATIVRQIAPSRKDRENNANDDSATRLCSALFILGLNRFKLGVLCLNGAAVSRGGTYRATQGLGVADGITPSERAGRDPNRQRHCYKRERKDALESVTTHYTFPLWDEATCLVLREPKLYLYDGNTPLNNETNLPAKPNQVCASHCKIWCSHMPVLAESMERDVKDVGRQKSEHGVKKALSHLTAKLDLLIALYVILEEEREEPAHVLPGPAFKQAWQLAMDRLDMVQVDYSTESAYKPGMHHGTKTDPEWSQQRGTLKSMERIAGQRKFMT